MTCEEKFWQIIAKLNWKKAGDDEAVLKPALKALAARSLADICEFADVLAEKLHAIDTREHARQAFSDFDPDDGDQYLSADAFLYARCFAVGGCIAHYDSVVSQPTEMQKDADFEALLSLAAGAYELKTGSALEHVSPVDFKTFANKEGWAKSAATRPGMYTSDTVPKGNRRPSS